MFIRRHRNQQIREDTCQSPSHGQSSLYRNGERQAYAHYTTYEYYLQYGVQKGFAHGFNTLERLLFAGVIMAARRALLWVSAVASRVAAMTTRRRRRAVVDSSDDDDDDAPSPPTHLPQGKSFCSSDPVNNVAVAESRVRKVIVRSVSGLGMVTGFVGIVWAGHLYLSALVVLIQVGRSLFLLPVCT